MKLRTQQALTGLRISVLTILLLAAMSSSATTITSAVASGTQLTITGSGFSGSPLTVTFNGKSLAIASSSATKIVATLNPVPAPGTYRLVVKSGTASTFSYVAISASPNVLANVALTNQAAAIPVTALFTPQSGGLFRISAYMQSPDSCGCGWQLYLSWTDEANYQAIGFGENGGSQWANPSIVVYDVAGQPLSYTVYAAPGGSSYDLHITVEQLQ